MSKQEETIISDGIKKFLDSKRIFNRRNHAHTSSYGLPDREFLYKGVCVGIEIKTPTGVAKQHQLRKLEQYNKNGGFGVVVTTVDEVECIVELIDYYYQDKEIWVGMQFIGPWEQVTDYLKEKFNEYQENKEKFNEYQENNV